MTHGPGYIALVCLGLWVYHVLKQERSGSTIQLTWSRSNSCRLNLKHWTGALIYLTALGTNLNKCSFLARLTPRPPTPSCHVTQTSTIAMPSMALHRHPTSHKTIQVKMCWACTVDMQKILNIYTSCGRQFLKSSSIEDKERSHTRRHQIFPAKPNFINRNLSLPLPMHSFDNILNYYNPL